MRTIKVAVIGVGLIGSRYARILREMPDVELVAVLDVVSERAEGLARALETRAYVGADYDRLFEAHPELDAVVVCTAEADHAQPALAALAAGKHLLIEKPLAATTAEAEEIALKAVKCPVVAMVAFSVRFDPRYTEMKAAVERGEVGDVIYAQARRNPPIEAFQRIGGRVELPFWVGVHDIDLLRWMLADEVVRVYAAATDRGLEGSGARRAVLTTLEFAGGAIAALENGWRAPSSANQQLSEAALHLYGTRGQVSIERTQQGFMIVRDGALALPDTTSATEVAGETVGMYRNQLAAFVRAVRDELPSPVPLADGVAATRVAEAILRSVAARQPVMVQQAAGEGGWAGID